MEKEKLEAALDELTRLDEAAIEELTIQSDFDIDFSELDKRLAEMKLTDFSELEQLMKSADFSELEKQLESMNFDDLNLMNFDDLNLDTFPHEL